MAQSKPVAHVAHGAPPLPFWKQLLAGGSAGIVEILCMYPTDVVKTRHQLSTERQTMIGTFKSIRAKEGLGTFYRGIGSPLLAEGPKRAIKFGCNDQYKQLLKDPNGALPPQRAFVAGAMAGATEMFVNCPFEVVKVRMQAPEAKGLYTSTMHCASTLIKEEGFKGLYRGGETQLWRNAVWNGVYFGIIDTMKYMFPAPKNTTHTQHMLYDVGIGALSGGIATTFNTPFDVVKSRMQNQKKGGTLKYNWAMPSLVTVLREEGFRALYKGYGPRLLRLGPGGGIMLMTNNKVKELIKDW